MIRDEELRSSLDYSEGQKEAAHRVLVELVNLFNEYRDDIRIVGGWVPDLMFPGEGHVGSIDVDVLINHIKLKDNGYLTMAKILLRNGYKEHPEKYFSFVKQVQVDGISYDVDVDILFSDRLFGAVPFYDIIIDVAKTTAGHDPRKVRLLSYNHMAVSSHAMQDNDTHFCQRLQSVFAGLLRIHY